ncbi:hypothetical protein WN944_006163 [Citrus x changshan-huyou]|uniref:Uncharacterized protein n=1 Tax=Citrus x changshan-huyou TaxID=2935761 RepID=A0AAP0MNU9_9ROSI
MALAIVPVPPPTSTKDFKPLKTALQSSTTILVISSESAIMASQKMLFRLGSSTTKSQKVIVGGPTLVGDSSRSRKNDSRCAITSRDVLCNILAAKRANTRQVPIMWTDGDDEGVLYRHEDALVTSAVVMSKMFVWILVDTGSSVDVLF